MNLIKSETLENSRHELQFSVDAESFNAAIAKAFKKQSGKYNIPGFRKGKAPRNMIEKMYGADVFHYDAINELFPEAYEAAVAEAGISPVDRPEVDIVSASTVDGAVLQAIVTVMPVIELGTYKGLKVTKTVKAVNEADVTAEIDRMRDRNARVVTSTDKAINGDITDIDFDGYVDGVAFDGGKAENFSLTLGSGQFIPGFEEQIIGHETGEEFDVNVTFPADYQEKALADKVAVFKIKLNEIKRKEMPVADDEFAKDVSEFDTIAELENSIRKGLEETIVKSAELEVENELVEQVIATMKGEIPEVMFEGRIDEMVRDFEYRLSQQGLKLADYIKYTGGDETKFREGFKEQAEKQVKIRLALEKVSQLENIVASDEDLETEIARIALSYKMEVDKVRELIPVEDVKKDLAVNKSIDFLKQNAIIVNKEEASE